MTEPDRADLDSSDAASLVEYLRDCDVTCPACGYNLRGLVSPRCPECGWELTLTVGAVEPFLRAWVTLVVGSCASAGIGFFFLLLVMRSGWPKREPALLVSVFIFIASIRVAGLVLLARRRFLKLIREVQWRITTLGTVMFLGGFLLLLFSALR
ncbi:MAG TPA: hypothetical protein VLJ39_17665 [Tepidisphaeraceae bacterium]|jgi:hypothetical protein|nr:hypothetical protein [Tepidisphaeraceae bacterium]